MNTYTNQFSQLFQDIAEELDIPKHYHEVAVNRYKSIGEWLDRDKSTVAIYKPEIYPQGSFLLGTVTKPISENEEYDLDLVSELTLLNKSISQAYLKKLVGDEIKEYVNRHSMKSPVEEGRRCWTLDYADKVQFHIDILPAIPDGEDFKQLLTSRRVPSSSWTDSAIAITDNTLLNYDQIDSEWPRSNPKGYAAWFQSRMQTRLDAILVERQVESVPDYKTKTPLQYAVQLLKRHRDIWFESNKSRYHKKTKPISIIITTLAALAYENESDLQQALSNIVNNMHIHIKLGEKGEALILNPVNPFENFADKWQEKTIPRELCFRDWLDQVRNDFNNAFELNDIRKVGEALKPCLGERVINKVLQNHSDTNNIYVPPLIASVIPKKQYADEKPMSRVTSSMAITDDEVKWLESNFPTLYHVCDFSKITGELRFCAAYDNRTGRLEIGEHTREMNRFISDTFDIEIYLDKLDKNGWSTVYEIGGRHHRISKKYDVPIIDLHFYPNDDSCCLGLNYAGNRNLRIKEFLLDLVIPFFYRLSYTEEFGIEASSKDLWGEYSHGKQGHDEYINDIMNIAKQRLGRNDLCSCGSGKKYKKCHMDQVEFIKHVQNAAISEAPSVQC